jgi:hypothetical protein
MYTLHKGDNDDDDDYYYLGCLDRTPNIIPGLEGKECLKFNFEIC